MDAFINRQLARFGAQQIRYGGGVGKKEEELACFVWTVREGGEGSTGFAAQ